MSKKPWYYDLSVKDTSLTVNHWNGEENKHWGATVSCGVLAAVRLADYSVDDIPVRVRLLSRFMKSPAANRHVLEMSLPMMLITARLTAAGFLQNDGG